MKKFIITMDTEGDNLWNWKNGDIIKTENTLFLNRFQEICNEYGFKPVWLTNYEMLQDDRYIDFIKNVVMNNQGEVGMHLHAWSTPPFYSLPYKQNGAPYLIEYPYEVMEEKIKTMTDTIVNVTGEKPVSHRSGRWAMDQRYFDILIKYGYKVDCSVTPHINWKSSVGQTQGSTGSDYSNFSEQPYWVYESTGENRILEVPVTIKKSHKLFHSQHKSVKKYAGDILRSIRGEALWIRPNGANLRKMIFLLDENIESESDYVMFMLHSSELMPGGSPTFKNKEDIECLYNDMELLFKVASKNYSGITLKEYINEYDQKNN